MLGTKILSVDTRTIHFTKFFLLNLSTTNGLSFQSHYISHNGDCFISLVISLDKQDV